MEGVRPDFRIKVSPLSGSGQSMFLFVVQICVIKLREAIQSGEQVFENLAKQEPGRASHKS